MTGKAGTGKTTFLHGLKGNTAKRMVVTAPTGVAAINAGGVTLHSFFQLPFGPYIPGSENVQQNKQRMFSFSREKRKIIRSLDLLVVDEISMVRADMLDSVDAVLRQQRRNDQPFGGVQLLLIGDLHQLSPVAKKSDWQLLHEHYESVYFFSSHALARTELLTVELNHIYRQTDDRFINLLNRVRSNLLDSAALDELNQRYVENFVPREDQGYITLTTHNNSADATNHDRLWDLPGNEHHFKASITGEFPDHIHPTPENLVFKIGAQVMFLRNDTSPERRFYNGKIGKILSIANQQIRILCPDETDEIVVEPVEWENIKYTVNPETKEIQEEVIGKFKQFPLKLAWAITIHKSQGLTFERAVIDAQSAFTHGQIYVALSRCKSFEGMILSSPLPSHGIEPDGAVLGYLETARQNPPSETGLTSARIVFQQQLLLECFDFGSLYNRLNYLARILVGNSNLVQISGGVDFQNLQKEAGENIFSVGEKFTQQLRSIFRDNIIPDSDDHTNERTSRASGWFQEKFAQTFNDFVERFQVETDNRELSRRIDNALTNLKQEIAVKLAGIKACEQGFNPTRYLGAVAEAEMDFAPEKSKKSTSPDYGESDIEHPELFQSLKEWRRARANEDGVPAFVVLHQKVLIQIVVNLPDNPSDLKKIKGVGDKTLEKYGHDILQRVLDYRKQHGIKEVVLPRPRHPLKTLSPNKGEDQKSDPDKKKKPGKKSRARDDSTPSDTVQASFDLFEKGLTIADIAKERGLVENTIQGHLSFYVENGTLDIDRLLSPEKQKAIKTAMDKLGKEALSPIKAELGDGYSYGDIKLMTALEKHLSPKE